MGHEEEELKPYIEPEADFNDSSRIGMPVCMCLHISFSISRLCDLL